MSICNLPTRLNLISNESDLSPCSDLEIIQLERQQGINLPSTYKDFLKMMGHGAGKFLRGSDCFYQHLPQIQEWAKQLLVENDFPQTLPEDAFVFFMHQGYQFSFFRLSEGDNPPTYSYCEGQEEAYFVKSHDQFSDFLSVEINLYLEILNFAKQRILALQNKEKGENMSEKMIFKMNEEKITRLEYIQKLLEKIYNGVIRKTWKFQDKFRRESSPYVYNLRGMASAGDCVVEFGVSQDFDNFNYYLNIKSASNPEEEIVNESHYYECDNSNYSYQEFKLIQEYLEKIEKASWQVKLSDLDALPE